MSETQRIQLSRRAGWTMPEDAVKVSRGTWLGNPFRVYEHCKGRDGDWGVEDTGRFNTSIGHGWTKRGAVNFAIDCYKQQFDEHFPPGSSIRAHVGVSLYGKKLACWCAPGEPCHADFLVSVAGEYRELALTLRKVQE
jgi:hypothetical protein